MRELQVNTRYGTVEGEHLHGTSVWKGIPYAKPPVGELRFQAPIPPESWDGIREAKQFGPENIQPRHHQAEGIFGEPPAESEDSLYLNIWAPEKKASILSRLWYGFMEVHSLRGREASPCMMEHIWSCVAMSSL